MLLCGWFRHPYRSAGGMRPRTLPFYLPHRVIIAQPAGEHKEIFVFLLHKLNRLWYNRSRS